MLGQLLPTFYKYRESGSGDKYMSWRLMTWKILVEDYFNQYFSSKDIVLDLPSGFGEFINNVKCKTKIAADLNPHLKKYLNPGIKFIACSSEKIKLPAKSVDKIFCSNFFEHITHEQILKTIGEFRRVLKDDGKVLVLQPNIRFLTKDYWRFFDHITAIDDRGLEDAFVIQGFELDFKVERFFPFTFRTVLPKSSKLIRLYLRVPLAWRFLGTQSFLIFKKLKKPSFISN